MLAKSSKDNFIFASIIFIQAIAGNCASQLVLAQSANAQSNDNNIRKNSAAYPSVATSVSPVTKVVKIIGTPINVFAPPGVVGPVKFTTAPLADNPNSTPIKAGVPVKFTTAPFSTSATPPATKAPVTTPPVTKAPVVTPVVPPVSVSPGPVPAPSGGVNGAGGNKIFGVQEFPANNMLNTIVTGCPVDPNNEAWFNALGHTAPIKCDFDSISYVGIIGIPYNVIQPGQGVMVPVKIGIYASESDAGPYLFPKNMANVKVEGSSYPGTNGNPDANGELGTPNGSGDGHYLGLDVANGITYELINAKTDGNGNWTADSGAIFHFDSNAERKPGYTSACAYGYSLLVPLVKYAEVQQGVIKHAISVNLVKTAKTYAWPANHEAGNHSSAPPMGQYMRLKASVASGLISKAPPQAKVILQALATYGAIVTQNGSTGFLQGDANAGWNHNDLAWIKNNTSFYKDMEFIDVNSLEIAASTAQARAPGGVGGSGGGIGAAASGGTSGLWIEAHHNNSAVRKE